MSDRKEIDEALDQIDVLASQIRKRLEDLSRLDPFKIYRVNQNSESSDEDCQCVTRSPCSCYADKIRAGLKAALDDMKSLQDSKDTIDDHVCNAVFEKKRR
jgi:hypothetical protein